MALIIVYRILYMFILYSLIAWVVLLTGCFTTASGSNQTAGRQRPSHDAALQAVSEVIADDGNRTDPCLHSHLSLGREYGCAIIKKTVVCWGETPFVRGKVVHLIGIEDPLQVALGLGYGCVLETSGRVLCWGGLGSLGLPHFPVKNKAALVLAGDSSPSEKVRRIWAGPETLCLQAEGRAARCHGRDYRNPFTRNNRVAFELMVQSLAFGTAHACLVENGKASCIGSRLGYFLSATDRSVGKLVHHYRGGGATKVELVADQARCVVTGQSHACVLHQDKGVSCYGFNNYGGLGDDQASGSSRLPLTEVIQLASGGRHICALHFDGTVSCWGAQRQAIPGRGGRSRLQVQGPTQVPGLVGVRAISANDRGTCALRDDDRIVCWGTLTPTTVDGSVIPLLELDNDPPSAAELQGPTPVILDIITAPAE